MQDETDWPLHPDWEAIQRLKMAELKSKRRQAEYLLPYVSNKSKLAETMLTLIGLIDRIRMLDNDIIRLQQKLDTVIELRDVADKKDSEKNN